MKRDCSRNSGRAGTGGLPGTVNRKRVHGKMLHVQGIQKSAAFFDSRGENRVVNIRSMKWCLRKLSVIAFRDRAAVSSGDSSRFQQPEASATTSMASSMILFLGFFNFFSVTSHFSPVSGAPEQTLILRASVRFPSESFPRTRKSPRRGASGNRGGAAYR